jgi:SAM-dependent methyltransferase
MAAKAAMDSPSPNSLSPAATTAVGERPCKICNSPARLIGSKNGRLQPRPFHFYQCAVCGFLFVADPWTDYAEIYSEDYYRGKGVDPYVDYVFELEHPEVTVRRYEWRGILAAVERLQPLSAKTRWLDYGCGNGGLVRHVKEHAPCLVEGVEQGWIHDLARTRGIALLEDRELETRRGTYDIVTAIEVLEHIDQPLDTLRRIRGLLRPGGLFFFTTGNLEMQRKNPLAWGYALPEIHVSFYEPRTLEHALQKTGFRSEFHGFTPGFEDIVRFKILKTAGVRRVSPLEKYLPWGPLSKLADKKTGVSRHPVAWAI